MPRGILVAAIGLVIGLAAAGCGERPIPTVKLGGTVTLDGKPLSQSLILFYRADQDGASPVAVPVTDGRYVADVVPKGKYRVAFRSALTPEGYGEPTAPVDSSFAAPTAADRQKRDPIPAKFQQPSLDVDASADNTNLNFDLKST